MSEERKKYELTEEHKSQLKPWADRWIANALNCDTLSNEDRTVMIESMTGMYQAADMQHPPRNIFVDSPLTGALAASIASGVWWLRENPEEQVKLFGKQVSEDVLMAAVRRASGIAARQGQAAMHGMIVEGVVDAPVTPENKALAEKIKRAVDMAISDKVQHDTLMTLTAVERVVTETVGDASRFEAKNLLREVIDTFELHIDYFTLLNALDKKFDELLRKGAFSENTEFNIEDKLTDKTRRSADRGLRKMFSDSERDIVGDVSEAIKAYDAAFSHALDAAMLLVREDAIAAAGLGASKVDTRVNDALTDVLHCSLCSCLAHGAICDRIWNSISDVIDPALDDATDPMMDRIVRQLKAAGEATADAPKSSTVLDAAKVKAVEAMQSFSVRTSHMPSHVYGPLVALITRAVEVKIAAQTSHGHVDRESGNMSDILRDALRRVIDAAVSVDAVEAMQSFDVRTDHTPMQVYGQLLSLIMRDIDTAARDITTNQLVAGVGRDSRGLVSREVEDAVRAIESDVTTYSSITRMMDSVAFDTDITRDIDQVWRRLNDALNEFIEADTHHAVNAGIGMSPVAINAADQHCRAVSNSAQAAARKVAERAAEDTITQEDVNKAVCIALTRVYVATVIHRSVLASVTALKAEVDTATPVVTKFLLMCSSYWWRMWNGGNQWSGSVAFYSFFREIAKLDLPVFKDWIHYERAAIHGGPRFLHKHFWIVSDRPKFIHRDAENRPHCETGPYCEWRDGWSLYYVHGVAVPKWIVEEKDKITPEKIEAEQNAEVRRIMIGFYGQARYLADSGAVVVHRDDWGTLYRKELAGDEPLVMVKVVNSTPEPDGTMKDYFLRVNPELRPLMSDGTLGEPQELTAKNAVASTFGKYGKEYKPGVQT